MAVQLILKNSAVQDKEATANQLATGELALNYYESGPFLQCKDTSGAVWRLGGVVIASTAPSSPSKGAWWLDSDDDHLYFYDGTSWIEIQTGEIVPGDITEGTARQLLQTNAAGTATEWTSNIDVPGTLDVTGVATFDNNVVITGNLTVNGTTTTIDTTTLVVEDKNIELGVVGTPTDTTADGGGITVKGATDKTLTWVNSTGMWTSNQPFDVAGEVQCDSLDVDGAADISGDVTLHGNLDLQDNDRILIGTGDDLDILHNGTDSVINNYTGKLILENYSDDKDIELKTDNGSGSTTTYVLCDGSSGAVNLNHYGSNKLATTSTGINVTGEVTCDGLTSDGIVTINASSPQLIIKDSDSTGASAYGNVVFRDSANAGKWLVGDFSTTTEDAYLYNFANADVVLATNNNGKRVRLNTDGHWVPGADDSHDLGISSLQWRDGWFDGTVNCDQLDVDGTVDITGNVTLHADLDLQDSDRILIGTGDDLQLYHDGTNSSINNYAGDLYIQNYADDKAIVLQTDNGSGGVTAFVRCDGNNGEVDLYHYGTQKLRTTSSGIDVTGTVTCDALTVYETSGNAQATFQSTAASGIAILEIGGPSGGYIDLKAPFSDNYDLRIFSTGAGGNIFTNGGNVQFNTNVVPDVNNAYDLGNSSNKWRNAYFDGTVNCDGLSVDGTTHLQHRVYSTENTATASSFNLADGNFWTFGAIAVPNPTNQTGGMMGSLRVTAAPTSFASDWKFPGGSYTAPTSFPAVAPFFIQASGTILVGSWTEGIA